MMQADQEGWTIRALVTDIAGQCGRARHILAKRWPRVTFLFCIARDINNLVKEVLRSSFSTAAHEATALVKCLNASSA